MNKFKSLKYWLPLAVAIALTCGFWLGYFLRGLENDTTGKQKIQELFSLIEDNYVDSVNIDTLIENSIPAILRNLDPHSAYIPVSEIENANMMLKGSFGGVGIQFQIYRDTINVVEVVEGGPSEKAGIQAGDRIVAVNGKNVTGNKLTDDMVRDTLRGPEGSNVRLSVFRPLDHNKKLSFNIRRGTIPINSIDAAYMISKNTGLIKVSSFGEKTYYEFLQALTSLATKGAENYIIDLRGNTGGYMETAIMMVNEFMPAGKEIVRTRGIHSTEDIVLTDGHGSFQNAKLAVLIDELSASSSEIFAGALQDNDRAIVIGRRSFGKGLVQKPMTLSDGSELRLTVQRYYTPSGRSIQKQYKPGDSDYEYEIFERFKHGENLNADSIKFDKSLMYKTNSGRTVYGGGGIMPDIFVPNDTSGVTNYYVDIANAGLLNKFAYEYADINRLDLSQVKDVSMLLRSLPSDDILLSSFVYYATQQGIPARWYYIKLSRRLIVSQLKALIARNTLGIPAYFEVINSSDINVTKALEQINSGAADFPIKPEKTQKQ